MKSPHPTAQDLLRYIDASPTPQHCVAETARRLEAEGFTALDEAERWTLEAGDGRFLVRGGTILAFRVGTAPPAEAGFRLLGAHTDSPNLRVKPVPDVRRHGYAQLGVEAYGGLLEYTWLDRDLGLAGEVLLAREGADGATGVESRLVRVDRPILRIPSLAIHLNREIRDEGLKLNRQQHLPPILSLGDDEEGDGPGALRRMLARELEVEADRILSWDLSLMDVVPAAFGGLRQELVLAPRMDNQAMCHAALSALLRADEAAPTQIACLYDHEEVGSGSAAGAAGDLVRQLLARLAEVEAPGASPGVLPRAVARSLQISADMAHAVHPNYADKHDPQHMPRINAGPVIKINTQQRYATDAETEARFEALCRDEGVPCQKYVNRTDLACGSTIGPISAARLGIRTVDVGNPMLAMHSIRETGGSEDPERMTAVMARFLVT